MMTDLILDWAEMLPPMSERHLADGPAQFGQILTRCGLVLMPQSVLDNPRTEAGFQAKLERYKNLPPCSGCQDRSR